MGCFRQAVCAAIVGGWAAFMLSGEVFAQTDSAATTLKVHSTRDYWEQQVLRTTPAQPSVSQQAPMFGPTLGGSSPLGEAAAWAPVETVSAEVPADPLTLDSDMLLDDMETIPNGKPLPLPHDDAYYAPGGYGPQGFDPGCSSCGECYDACSCGNCYGGSCGECYDGYSCGGCSHGGYCGLRCAWGGWLHRHFWWTRNLTLFAGVHGFKGPADQGRNGNFGFHEGLNWGAPLGGPFGLGYQVGVQAVHSNFSGDQAEDSVFREADRNQVFFTAGLFRRRLCGGLQWGVAFDMLHDHYHGTAELRQIRSETALSFGGCREIGYMGAYGVGDDAFTYEGAEARLTQGFAPNDTFSLFYRRRFSAGGQGRVWAGLSGNGDALIGAECTVPLGTSWALENNFLYLIPKDGQCEGGQQDETWSVSMQLVWYPGREAACVLSNPFHPLFNVADNSQFLIDPR